MAIKKRDSRNVPKRIKTNKSKGKDNFPESKEIRRTFQASTDRKKYDARLLRRSVNGAFGKEKVSVYNQMVIGTRGVERVEAR
jgi:hypothetical protein